MQTYNEIKTDGLVVRDVRPSLGPRIDRVFDSAQHVGLRWITVAFALFLKAYSLLGKLEIGRRQLREGSPPLPAPTNAFFANISLQPSH